MNDRTKRLSVMGIMLFASLTVLTYMHTKWRTEKLETKR